MRKFLVIFLLSCIYTAAWANTAESAWHFRAMKDEMNRTLKELYLPGNLRPYYVAYWLEENYRFVASASLGDVYTHTDRTSPNLYVNSVLKVGNNQNNNTGYYNYDRAWEYVAERGAPASYEGIRQALWENSNRLYLDAIEQYKEKEAYRRRKNIKNPLPDVVPAAQATYVEEIPAWQQPDRERLDQWVRKVSAWGNEVPFFENFEVEIQKRQQNYYYLNSRGGKGQWPSIVYECRVDVEFSQPDGYKESWNRLIMLRDFSEQELERAEAEVKKFIGDMQGIYGAPEAEVYLGPVLYDPAGASEFLDLLLGKLRNMAPWWNNESDEDDTASLLRKKIGMRVLSPGINIYDRPKARTFRGFELVNFSPIDKEGVASEELTLVSGEKLQQVPLSQRPLNDKKHKSNGHAFKGIGRERLSSVFVEPENPLTKEQLKAKLMERCKELELPYCYIARGDSFRRVYTDDGHEEWVVGLYESNWTSRSLRDILAAGSDFELGDYNVITPSILVDEIELMSEDRRPERKPFIDKPQ